MCLQETKQNQMDNRRQQAICGAHLAGWESIDARGSAGGLLSCWDDKAFEGKLAKAGSYSLTIKLTNKSSGYSWLLSNIYGPHNEPDRRILFSELYSLKMEHKLPWVLIGDFNATRSYTERRGTGNSHKVSRLLIRLTSSLSLVEIKLSNRQFTWSNFRAEPSMATLDRCFTSTEWLDKYPLTNLTTLIRPTSDHTPLLLRTTSPSQGKSILLKPFRFEQFWFTVPGLEDLIQKWWQTSTSTTDLVETVNQKLRTLRANLRSWNRSTIGNIFIQKNNILNQIEHLDLEEEQRNLEATEMQERSSLKEKLELLLTQEELIWKQRARVIWLNNGDRNTKFFHTWASNRRRKNLITEIRHQQSTIHDIPQIHDCFRDHFKQLLGNQEIPSIKADWKQLYPEGPLQLQELEAPFTEEEIKNAVFQLASQKSPGPDGFSFEFYKKFWHILKHDLIKMFQNFYTHQISLDRLNYSYIALIPKKESSCSVKDFRPISLMNGITKIFSKVLSLRLAKKMESLIANSQSAFIQGRSTSDNFATAQEIISQAARSKLKGIVYKLDFEKAFDNVAWPFLFDLLQARGFGERWCKWMSDIVTTAKSSVLVNGTLGKTFKHSRGLRQGDPLSPQLFIIVADTLERILNLAARQSLLEGIGRRETT